MALSDAEQIDRDRERIREAEDADEDDRDNLLEVSKIMRRNTTEWGDKRHHSVLQRLIVLSWGGEKYGAEELHDTTLSAALDNQEAAGELVDWIESTYESEETKRDSRLALRAFGKILTNDDPTDKDATPPPSIDWVSATTPRNYKPRPNPAHMIHWPECKAMCDHPRTNPRDAALLAVAWDAGPRSGELQELTIGDVYDREIGKEIRVDGKTGPREVSITNAVPYLQQWLNQHPGGDDPDAPLWSKLKQSEGISYRLFRDVFENAAARVGLEKPNDPTNFRKSSISDLASKPRIGQATLEDRYGWERGSDAAARYIAVFSKARKREVAIARGVDVEIEEPDPTGPKPCIRCNELIDREADECYNCGAIQDRVAAQKAAATGGTDLRSMVREAVREELGLTGPAIEQLAEPISEDPKAAVEAMEEAAEELAANPRAADSAE